MTQQELNLAVLVATRYTEARKEIENALSALNNLKYINYCNAVDPKPLKKMIYDIEELLSEVKEFYDEESIIKYFKDKTNG